MVDLMTVLVGAAIVAAVVWGWRRRSIRRPGAVTSELVVDHAGVRRTLADGRTEAARWAQLTEVEVVHTPVPTADGARCFLVLTEDEVHGCLVPIGVGHDASVAARLADLAGFDLTRYRRLLTSTRNGRETVWRQPAGGARTEGTGNSE